MLTACPAFFAACLNVLAACLNLFAACPKSFVACPNLFAGCPILFAACPNFLAALLCALCSENTLLSDTPPVLYSPVCARLSCPAQLAFQTRRFYGSLLCSTVCLCYIHLPGCTGAPDSFALWAYCGNPKQPVMSHYSRARSAIHV